jgi:hypothetical protein
MKRATCAIALLLLTPICFSGCSMLTAQGRRERAYERYVRKYSHNRVKQQSRISSWRAKIPQLTPSEPVVRTEVSGPEAATSGDGGM